MPKHEQDIKQTLREILCYVGADMKYVEYAQLQSYMEWFLIRCAEKAK
jgi:hypothetical protein